MSNHNHMMVSSNLGVFALNAVGAFALMVILLLAGQGVFEIPAMLQYGLYAVLGALILAQPLLYNHWIAGPLQALAALPSPDGNLSEEGVDENELSLGDVVVPEKVALEEGSAESDTLDGDDAQSAENTMMDDVPSFIKTDSIVPVQPLHPYGVVLGPIGAKLKHLSDVFYDSREAIDREVNERVHRIERERLISHRKDMEQLIEGFRTSLESATSVQKEAASESEKLLKKNEELSEKLASAQEKIASDWRDAGEAVQAHMSDTAEGFEAKLNETSEGANAKLTEIAEGASTKISELTEGTGAKLSEMVEGYQAKLGESKEAIEQKLSEGIDGALTRFDEKTADLGSDIKEELSDLGNIVRSSFDDISEAANKGTSIVKDEMDKLAGSLNETQASVRAASDGLETLSETVTEDAKASVASLDIELRDVSSRFVALYENLEKDATQISEHKTAFDAIDFGGMTELLSQFGSSIEKIESISEAGAGTVERVTAAADSIENAAGTIGGKVEESTNRLQSSVGNLASAGDKIEETVTTFMDRLKRAAFIEYQTLKKATDSVRKELDQQKSVVNDLGGAIDQITNMVEAKSSELVGRIEEQLSGDAASSKAAFQEAADTLIAKAREASDALAQSNSQTSESIIAEARTTQATLAEMLTSRLEIVMNGVEAVQQNANDKIDSGVTQVTDKAESMIAEATNRISGLVDGAESAFVEPLKDLQSMLGNDNDGLNALLSSLRQLLDDGRGYVEEQMTSVSTSNQATSAIVEVSKALESKLNGQAELLANTVNTISGVARTVENRLPENMERATAALDKLTEEANENRAAVQNGMASYIDVSQKLKRLAERLSEVDLSEQKVNIDHLTENMKAIARNMPNIGREVSVSVSNDLSTKFGEIDQSLSKVRADLSRIDSLSAAMSSVEKAVQLSQEKGDDGGVATQLASLSTLVTGGFDALRAVVADKSSAQSPELSQQWAKLEGQFAGLKAKLESDSVGATATASSLRDVQQDLASLKTGLDSLVKQQSKGSGSSAELKLLGDQLSGQLSGAVSNQLSNLPGQLIGQIDQRFKVLETKLSQATAGTGSEKGADKGTDNEALIAQVSDLVKDLRSDLNSIRGDIGAVEANVAAQTADIAGIPSALDQLRSGQIVGASPAKVSIGGSLEGAEGEINALFEKLERDTESLVEQSAKGGSRARRNIEAQYAQLVVHRDNIENWSRQLRNVSTAMALLSDMNSGSVN